MLLYTLNLGFLSWSTPNMRLMQCQHIYKREQVIPIHTKANWKDNSCLLKQYSSRTITVTWLQNITTH